MLKRLMQLIILLSVCLAAACNKPAYQPSYAVCCKVSDYPALVAAGYNYAEATVGGFLVPDKDDAAFIEQLDEMKRLNAKVVSCVNFIPAKLPIVGPEPKHDDILVWAETALRRAQTAGMSYIVFGSGGARKVPDGFDKQRATEQFVDLCKKLGPIAGKYNMTIVVEPLNKGETNLINSVKEGADIVNAVNHPNIRLLCDIYHMMRENEPADEIVKYASLIRHCHIAEKETRSAPGTAGDDFTPYFKALKQINYQGTLSIECKWNDFAQQLAPALQYMKKQFESLK